MPEISVPAIAALWLGVLTSISPCPLATNIAAVSYIGKSLADTRMVFWSGLAYVAGRTMVYVLLGFLLVKSLVAASGVSFFLQKYGNQILGPLLIVVGLFLLRFIKLEFLGFGAFGAEKFRNSKGVIPALLMGAVFALSFCPVSAALYFGALVPLAVKESSSVVLPSLYGIGTGLPVALFAVLLALGLQSAGRFYDGMASLERVMRIITGIVFVAAGGWLCVKYILPLLSGGGDA